MAPSWAAFLFGAVAVAAGAAVARRIDLQFGLALAIGGSLVAIVQATALATDSGIHAAPTTRATGSSASDSFSPPRWIFAIAGPIALSLVLLEIGIRWQRRRSVWLTAPDQLAEPQRQSWAVPTLLVCGLALAAFIGALRPGYSLIDVMGLAMAAIAVLAIGHLNARVAVGELGLALAAAALGLILVYFVATPSAAPLGIAIAGLWMLWLARFWSQQLDAGKPWTTAGRLIPAARRLGAASAMVFLANLSATVDVGTFWRVFNLVTGLALTAALTIAARREGCRWAAAGSLAGAAGVAVIVSQIAYHAGFAAASLVIGAMVAAAVAGGLATSRNRDGETVRAGYLGVGSATMIGIAISKPGDIQLIVAASVTLLAGLLWMLLGRRAVASVDIQS